MTKSQKVVYNWLMKKSGYLKCSAKVINKVIDTKSSLKDIGIAIKQARSDIKLGVSVISPNKAKSSVKLAKTPIKKIKRLFFDIETSPNIVTSWRVGYNLNIGPESIIRERAIICVCWKWEGSSKQYSLQWNNGDDKQLLKDFVEVLGEADEICGHNSDRFDIKWLRTRCYINGIPMFPAYQSIDTLKLAKAGFYFNSNKLDYLGKVSGFGGKKDTGGMQTWNSILFDNCPKAMKKMIHYCHGDIDLLEKVYKKLDNYTLSKTHVGVLLGKEKCSCSSCGSNNTHCNKTRVLATGMIKKQMLCRDCGKMHSVAESTYKKEREK